MEDQQGHVGPQQCGPIPTPHPQPDAQDSGRGASHWGDGERDRGQSRGGCRIRYMLRQREVK